MSGATKSSATQKPWDIQIPYLESGFKKAQELFDKGMPKYYGKTWKDTMAQLTPEERQAQHGITSTAKGAAAKKVASDARSQLAKTYGLSNRLASQAQRYGTRAVSDAQKRANKIGAHGQAGMNYGDVATQYGLSQDKYAGMTPFQSQQLQDMLAGKVNTSATSGLKSVTGAMRRDIMDELQGPGGMLSQIRGQQVGYQPGGSSRGDIVTGMAAKGASQKLADQASRMYADAFAKAQERRLPAGQMALQAQQAAQQLGLSGGNLWLGAGQLAQQGYGTGLQGVSGATQAGQLGLGALDRVKGVQDAMYDRFGRMQTVGQQKRAYEQEKINQKMARYNYNKMAPYQALQNYMSMISGQYGGQSTAKPSALTGMGQLASLFMGLSDVRAKENIVPDGTWKGHNVYNFNYKGDKSPRRGVMAQEVERTRPDAVYEIGGVKHVAYGLL